MVCHYWWTASWAVGPTGFEEDGSGGFPQGFRPSLETRAGQMVSSQPVRGSLPDIRRRTGCNFSAGAPGQIQRRRIRPNLGGLCSYLTILTTRAFLIPFAHLYYFSRRGCNLGYRRYSAG